MDFKKTRDQFVVLVIISFVFLFLEGCSNKEKNNVENTFNVELVNLTNDSLKQAISENIFGKVSFYRNNKLEILSINYVNDEFPDMHYFQNSAVSDKDIMPDAKKIRIEFKADFSPDSIKYSLQKYKYTNKQWIKTSDMGEIKETGQFVQPASNLKEFARKIVLNTIEYSYN